MEQETINRVLSRPKIKLGQLVAAVTLGAQGGATIWFWSSNIADQLVAPADLQSGPTTMWLGSTVLFLAITAGFQWTTMCHHRHYALHSWQAIEIKSLLVIMCASAVGGGACLVIYLVRRPSWTWADTICLIAVIAVQLLAIYSRRRTPVYRHPQLGPPPPTFWATARVATVEPSGRATIAISLRSIPRVFYALGFFASAISMGVHTIVSGQAMAAVRLLAAVQIHVRHPSASTKRLVQAELVGNFASQSLMAACWLVATHQRGGYF